MTASENPGQLSTDVVDGQTVQGTYGSDGSFLSQDGTTYVTASGQVEHGISDPATGDFLQNGQVRTIDGTQVYGTVQDATFYSADGTTLVTPTGFVEHGQTQPDGTFLASDVVNGQTLWGSYGSDGSFLSQDGTTYVTASGQVEYGITDPATGDFLQNGQVRTIDGTQVYGSVQDGTFYSADGTTLVTPTGFVEHGQTQPDGTFLASDVVNGQTLWGSYGSDGSFLSQDGTTYVTASGQVEYGITDPATGDFLQNGQVRTIDGTQVYGSVQDGTFYSADGTTLVTPTGFVEHGQTQPDGTFLASDVVNGQTLWGSYGSDGSFLSQDGTTYVTASGQVEYGITDPATGDFLQNGVTKTLADGTVLYGTMDGQDFISADGTTIVLADGTQLTGTLNTGDGIFTATNGSFYFVGDSGITPATEQSDGSFQLPDGSVVMTPAAWSVDLPAMNDAITGVSAQRDSIFDQFISIQTTLDTVENEWQSPAGNNYVAAKTNFTAASSSLLAVLDDAIDRMNTSYQNYLTTESTNTQNLQ